MEPVRTLARRFWNVVEPIHAAVYFEEEPRTAARDLGLKGFWMGYFAGRMAPLGPVGPDAVVAMTFGFAPWMVRRAIPDAWHLASPETILASRLDGSRAALARLLSERWGREVTTLDEQLWAVIDVCHFDGRPLSAAWHGVERPDDPLASLWLACTVLREHRGDGHVLAAVALGLQGIDATTTHIATGAITRELMMTSRGFTEDEMDASVARLQARGLLDRDGRLTKTGGALRRDLEATTDRLAAAPVERLGETGTDKLLDLATPIARHLYDEGAFPQPNPIGLPRP